eukprot:scaffold55582_cov47-Prasinocladus_malaysianus.AAC.4
MNDCKAWVYLCLSAASTCHTKCMQNKAVVGIQHSREVAISSQSAFVSKAQAKEIFMKMGSCHMIIGKGVLKWGDDSP